MFWLPLAYLPSFSLFLLSSVPKYPYVLYGIAIYLYSVYLNNPTAFCMVRKLSLSGQTGRDHQTVTEPQADRGSKHCSSLTMRQEHRIYTVLAGHPLKKALQEGPPRPLHINQQCIFAVSECASNSHLLNMLYWWRSLLDKKNLPFIESSSIPEER